MMRLFLGHLTGGSHERFLWEGQAAIHQHIGVKKRLGIRGIVFNRCLSLDVTSIAKEASHRGGDQLKPHVVEHRWEGDALRNRADVYAVEAPTVMSTPRSSGCAKLCAKGRLGKNCRPSWHRTTSNEPSLRRMVGGQHHHVSPQHLHAYPAHAAWDGRSQGQ